MDTADNAADIPGVGGLGPVPSLPEPSRADIADYLEQSQWDPGKARALATHATLTNLGVHPEVAASVAGTVARSATPVAAPPPSQPPAVGVPTPTPSGLLAPSVVPPARTAPVPSQSPQIDLSAGFVPKSTAANQPGGAKRKEVDLSGGLVPLNASPASSGAAGQPPTSQGSPEGQPEQPGFVERAYETSGMKSMVDSARAKRDAEAARNQEVIDHVKAGEWGKAAKSVLGALGADVGASALGPGGEFIKNTLQNTYEHGKQAINAIGRGDTGEAIAQGAESVPIVGPVAEQIGEPLGKDVREGNLRGAAGDIIGGTGAILALRGGGKAARGAPVETAPIEGAPLAIGEGQPGLARGATRLLSKTGTAEKPMERFMGERTEAIRNAADKLTPEAAGPEETGAQVQGAARDVLDRQQQAKDLTGEFVNRAQSEAAQASATATERAGRTAQEQADQAIQQAKQASEQAGTEAQRSAAEQLDARRRATVDDAQQISREVSGERKQAVEPVSATQVNSSPSEFIPVRETDRDIISSLRGANDSAKVEESAAHNALSEAAKDKGVTVKTSPMQSVAQDVVRLEGPAKDLVMSSLPATVYRTLEKVASNTANEGDVVAARAKDFGWDPQSLTEDQLANVKKDIAAHPSVDSDPNSLSEVPYHVMKTARTAVGEALQAARKHFQSTGMGSNAQRVLQQLYGSMSDAMKESLSSDPELSAQFEKANALTKQRNQTFVDPKFVRKLVYGDDAGRVMGAVMRSGSDADVAALRTALDADKTGQGLKSAQRGAMDYVLRRSSKAAKSELPSSVSPEAVDYDLALRNAKNTPALRTILGDQKYQTFLDKLDTKRIAQRTPDDVVFERQLEKTIKAETPEKAAEVAGKTVEPSNIAKRIAKTDAPEKAAKLIGYDASMDAGVQAAERRASAARSVADRLQSPTLEERGVQKVAEQAAHDLEPSAVIQRAAGSPELTDKLLSVLDKHPHAAMLRAKLGQEIFRSVSDKAMIEGAFGASDGTFDAAKFQTEYGKARPSLERILPGDNLKAMDEFNKALDKYALSKGIGGGAGMSGRFLVIRQLFGALGMAKGLISSSPSMFLTGAAASFGPRLWMEMVTRPTILRAATQALRVGAAGAELEGSQWRGERGDLLQGQLGASLRTSRTSANENPSQTANVSQSNKSTESSSEQESTPGKPISQGTGFQRPEMERHKRAGMRAAAESPNTPEHLREHLQGMAAPQVGDKVKLTNGKVATVEYAAPHDKLPVLRARTPDGKVFRYTNRKDIDAVEVVGTKYKYGSTQVNIPPLSPAQIALDKIRDRIADEDLAGQGKDVGGNHATVRYGIKGGDTASIKAFLASQRPFEATLGRTQAFPASEHSDGAAVIHAPIVSPELQRINTELEKHGEFTEPSFKEYRPHATLAYVKPESVAKYTGMKETEGKKFRIDRIAITDRRGDQQIVRLNG